MNKGLIVFVFSLFVFGLYSQVLFQERGKIAKQSKIFFKKTNLRSPGFIKADFYVRAGKYLPAYLCLGEYIGKSPFIKKISLQFKGQNGPLRETFNSHKISLKVENYTTVRRELKTKRLKFFLLILCSIYDDYADHILFGKDAYHLWNILLSMTEAAFKTKSGLPEDRAILFVSSHFDFFKKCGKWRKRAERDIEKINRDTITDEDARFVLKQILK